MRLFAPLLLLVGLFFSNPATAQDSACITKCVADGTAKESSGMGGELETGAKCGTEEGSKNRPKRFSRGHRPPFWEKGARWVSSGISDEYEGRASARLQNDGLELVIDSSCYTIGKGFRTEEAKYRWYGKWQRTLTAEDQKRIGDACAKQCP